MKTATYSWTGVFVAAKWNLTPVLTASAPSIQALLHFYVQLSAALADGGATAGLTVGYPLQTFVPVGAAYTNEGSNDGA